MKQNKLQTESGLKVGDQVKMIPGTLAWKAEIMLQGKIGELIESRADGAARKVTVRFPGGRLLIGRDGSLFERV